jgi:DNA repair ATPase RecN
MELTNEYCNEIIDLFMNDDDESMNKIITILSEFQEKYNNISTLNKITFRRDTKKIFNLLLHTIASEKALKEMDKVWEENFSDIQPTTDNLKEKLDYLDFTYNVKYVYDNIDNVNLESPDNVFQTKCNNVINYLKQGQNDIQELSNSMKELTNKLKEVHNILTNKEFTNNESV